MVKSIVLFLGISTALFEIIKNKASTTIIKNETYSMREFNPIEKITPITKAIMVFTSRTRDSFIVN